MAAEKLRRQQSLCGEVTVYILTNRHREELPQYFESQTVRPVVPTDDTLELVPLAAKALQRIFRKGYGYKKAGITLSDISSRTGLQTDLFDPGGSCQARPADGRHGRDQPHLRPQQGAWWRHRGSAR